jgi:hypothetical protein
MHDFANLKAKPSSLPQNVWKLDIIGSFCVKFSLYARLLSRKTLLYSSEVCSGPNITPYTIILFQEKSDD